MTKNSAWTHQHIFLYLSHQLLLLKLRDLQIGLQLPFVYNAIILFVAKRTHSFLFHPIVFSFSLRKSHMIWTQRFWRGLQSPPLAATSLQWCISSASMPWFDLSSSHCGRRESANIMKGTGQFGSGRFYCDCINICKSRKSWKIKINLELELGNYC